MSLDKILFAFIKQLRQLMPLPMHLFQKMLTKIQGDGC